MQLITPRFEKVEIPMHGSLLLLSVLFDHRYWIHLLLRGRFLAVFAHYIYLLRLRRRSTRRAGRRIRARLK